MLHRAIGGCRGNMSALGADMPHRLLSWNERRPRAVPADSIGADDEGVEGGVDFEKRIATIYQRCRQTGEIKAALDRLQLELSMEINEAMTRTRQKLLDNFDDEAREKLRVRDMDSKAYLNRFERILMQLTRHELADGAEVHAAGRGRRAGEAEQPARGRTRGSRSGPRGAGHQALQGAGRDELG